MDAMAADLLRRCAAGEISSAVALVRLLIAHGDLDGVRSALADFARPEGGSGLHGAIERIRELIAGNPAGSALVQDMLREEHASARPVGDAGDV